jgi:hypothetical protein
MDDLQKKYTMGKVEEPPRFHLDCDYRRDKMVAGGVCGPFIFVDVGQDETLKPSRNVGIQRAVEL